MKIDLDQNALKELISESIFNSFSEDQKQVMIKSALQYLLSPQENGGHYGRKQPSPLEEAFNRSISRMAEQLASTVLDNDPEVKSKLNLLIQEGITKVFMESREETVGKIADAIRKAVSGERY